MLVAEKPSQLYSEIEEILETDNIIYEKESTHDDAIDLFLKKSGNEEVLPRYEKLVLDELNFQRIQGTKKFYEAKLGDYEVDISIDLWQLNDGRWTMSSIDSDDSNFGDFLESYLGNRKA